MNHLRFKVQGMRCAACAHVVETALRSLAGVVDCEVHFAAAQARVTYDPQRVSWSICKGRSPKPAIRQSDCPKRDC
ncbi:cation transporter [Thermosynechococcus sp.]|uniref:cation transporter n=1 Tax=Thermosynechococcus sp. TaxID=2814275 RepID=UPI00391A6949